MASELHPIALPSPQVVRPRMRNDDVVRSIGAAKESQA